MHRHFQIFSGGTWCCEKIWEEIWEGVLYFRVLLHFYHPNFWSLLRGYMRCVVDIPIKGHFIIKLKCFYTVNFYALTFEKCILIFWCFRKVVILMLKLIITAFCYFWYFGIIWCHDPLLIFTVAGMVYI